MLCHRDIRCSGGYFAAIVVSSRWMLCHCGFISPAGNLYLVVFLQVQSVRLWQRARSLPCYFRSLACLVLNHYLCGSMCYALGFSIAKSCKPFFLHSNLLMKYTLSRVLKKIKQGLQATIRYKNQRTHYLGAKTSMKIVWLHE